LTLSIATWNINSVRLRINLVERFLSEHQPDVLCLQEIKCRDAEFPGSAFKALGYEHIAINGQKGYHGVATVSKRPFKSIERRGFCNMNDARHIAIDLEDGVTGQPLRIHNFYIPAGGDIPDPAENPKFDHKLKFLDELEEWTRQDKIAKDSAMLVGDLNIAPLEEDVWNHKAMLKIVSHTPIEVEKLTRIFETGQWLDAMRMTVPASEKLYTWWSYRAADWEASDRGRRLDHVWLSASLGPRLKGMKVLKAARGWDRPSDHAPVIITLDQQGAKSKEKSKRT